MLCLSTRLLLTLPRIPLHHNCPDSLFPPPLPLSFSRSIYTVPSLTLFSPFSHPQRSISSIRSRFADCCIIYIERERSCSIKSSVDSVCVSGCINITMMVSSQRVCVCACVPACAMCFCVFWLQRMSKLNKVYSERTA